jgi:hypothetical protein
MAKVAAVGSFKARETRRLQCARYRRCEACTRLAIVDEMPGLSNPVV